MRIRPTELGLKGGLLLCALVLAFLATPYSNLFFLLIAFSIVLGLFGALAALHNVRGVGIEVLAAPSGPAAQPRELRLALVARRRRAAFDLHVMLELPGVDASHRLAHVPWLRDKTVTTGVLPGQPRGVHASFDLRLVSRFPFGLFEANAAVRIAAELITHPAPLDSAELAALTQSDGDIANSLQAVTSSSVLGLRPFRSGDATADIHWKATARRGVPIVKERELDSGESMEIVIDRRCIAPDFERALSIAATALLQARARHRPVALRSQDYSGLFDGQARSAEPLLRWLAEARELPIHAPEPPRGRPGALLLPLRHAAGAVHA